IDDASLHAHLKQTLRTASDAGVDQVLAAYKAGRPGASNTDLYLIIASDATFRAGVLTEADRKAMQGKAAVYQYYFTWRSPVRQLMQGSLPPGKILPSRRAGLPWARPPRALRGEVDETRCTLRLPYRNAPGTWHQTCT